jgi:hypothetical protein
MPTSTKTLAIFFIQLHRCLEGKAILIGEILKLDIPLELFSVETLHIIDVRQLKITTPLIFHFYYWVDFFLHLPKIKNVIAPLVMSSLRTLEDH